MLCGGRRHLIGFAAKPIIRGAGVFCALGGKITIRGHGLHPFVALPVWPRNATTSILSDRLIAAQVRESIQKDDIAIINDAFGGRVMRNRSTVLGRAVKGGC
jgi:hypothetical protein